ncbi:GNAT family N-acetyltransferase [Fusobacteria bacterium ZRK30]|nr:GNAT family N-acetyltransferase [Fusobacteria bacterium ZRK30]
MEGNYIISKATKDDIVGIYNLLHREFVKKYSLNSEKEELEKHKKWYEFWLKSPYYLIYVIKDPKRKVIGQIRYEIDGEISIISIYLDKENRGKGLGKIFVERSIKELKTEKEDVKLIVAYILEENDISKKMFLNFGFLLSEKKNYNGIEHLIYTKKIR